jgi:hypothetical protein
MYGEDMSYFQPNVTMRNVTFFLTAQHSVASEYPPPHRPRQLSDAKRADYISPSNSVLIMW